MRILRFGSAAVLGGISLVLAGYAAWGLIQGFRPQRYETPAIFFTFFSAVAFAAAVAFAVPAATLVAMPRSVGWWTVAAVACSFATAVLLWGLIASAILIPVAALVPALGILAVATFVRTFIGTLRQRTHA